MQPHTLMELIGSTKVFVVDETPNDLQYCKDIAADKNAVNNDEAFYFINLDTIFSRFDLWTRELPIIEPFYAVKCNTDRVLIRVLAALGTSFDCASKEEIDIVMECGVAPEKIIYANPCKTKGFITHARECGVDKMTFDNIEELQKVAIYHPDAEMILRIAVSDPTATCPLNLKFGAEPVVDAPKLLKAAKELDISVVGISFHVGSGCNDSAAYRRAIKHAKELTILGRALGFKQMNIIDLGGGFPGGAHHMSFESIAQTIREAVDEHLGDLHNIRLIAEPGRFFAAAPFTLVANAVHGCQVPASRLTKDPTDDRIGYMYYLNDGVYGSFNCILFDHVHPVGRPLFDAKGEQFPSCIWGPTCDSMDQIEPLKMMRKLEYGEWMVYENMGAYTCSASTTFNGFQRPTPIYSISLDYWNHIKSSSHI